MSKLGSFFKFLGEKIVANKVRSIIIGSVAAVVIGGTTTAIVLTNSHDHTPLNAITENHISATCTTAGSYDEVIYCSDCEEEIERKSVTVKALGHTESEWIIDTNATCTENGNRYRECTVCNVTIKTETITKLPHTEGNWIIDVESTCSEEGRKHQICAICTETIKTDTISVIAHTEGDWIVDIKPTCAETGSKHQICSECGTSIKTEDIEKSSIHVYDEIITTPATCGTPGEKTHTCTVCNYSYTATISPTQQHSYSTPIITEATCGQNGKKEYNCSVCAYSMTTTLPATGKHSYTATTTKNATCAEMGIWTYTCSTCNDSFTKSFSQSTRVHGTVTNGYCDTCNKYLGSSDTYSNSYYKKLKYHIIDNGTFDSTNKRYTWKINSETGTQGSRYVYYAYYDSSLNVIMLSLVWDNTHVFGLSLNTKLSTTYAWTYVNTDGFQLAGTINAKSYSTSTTVLYPSESNVSDGNISLVLRQMSATMLNLILINFNMEVKPILNISCDNLGFWNVP